MNKLLIASALLTALTGCQSTSSVGNDINQLACYFEDDIAQEREAPQWVCDKMPEGVKVGSRGYSEQRSAGLRLMRKIATNDARRGLAESFAKELKNDYQQQSKNIRETGGDAELDMTAEGINDAINSVSSVTLTDSRVMASVRSPAGGLYVLVGMDEKAYQENKLRVEAALKLKNPKSWKTIQEIEQSQGSEKSQ